VALREFYQMGLPAERRIEIWLGSLCGSVLLLLMALAPVRYLPVWPAAGVLLFGSWYLFRFQRIEQVGRDLAISLMGLVYLPCLLVHVSFLFQLPFGRKWVFLVLLVVMSADTAAYFVGSLIGRSKLYPAISPNKSWEGSIGGVVGSLLGAALAKFWFFPELSLVDVVLGGILLSLSGQLGDLFESMLKRSFGVKDSGTMIPGHGGLLDRLDSLLFAFPTAFFYAVLLF
jgi:phosphatidate cytidylyltransferase